MIEKIENVDAFYPTFIKAEVANDFWRGQVGDEFDNLCFLRLYDVTIEDDLTFWAHAQKSNVLKGIAYYNDKHMATEYVLAFRTQADAMLWKLTYGGAA